jgi:hypothetical protein
MYVVVSHERAEDATTASKNGFWGTSAVLLAGAQNVRMEERLDDRRWKRDTNPSVCARVRKASVHPT